MRSRLLIPRSFGKGRGSVGRIEATSFAADTAGMAEKPEPPKPTSWDVYKIAKKAMWLGTVEAPDKSAAVEKAAQEFNTEVWRLYAVSRR
jgi:Ser/Thr protein kinase RdoA (MazF antagonist)